MTSANVNYITINSHRVRKQGKNISGFIYLTTNKGVSASNNIVRIGLEEVSSTIYLSMLNLSDREVGYATIENNAYIKNGYELVAGKVYFIEINFLLP